MPDGVPAPHIDKLLADNGGKEPSEIPCRCGVTHTGPYAIYDWGHHNCIHQYTMIRMAEDSVMCPGCGNIWDVEEKDMFNS